MEGFRRISLLASAALLAIALMVGWASARPSISAGSAAQLSLGSAFFDSSIVLARNSRPTGARGDALTVALGYVERLRIGAGSPFRLVDEALHDPRIDPWIGKRVTWALLDRLRRGDAYVVDPLVLDGSGPWAPDGHGATGAAHLDLIERAIAHASDPRAAELAVRLAYMIAAGKGTVSSAGAGTAIQVAALVRDRRLAEADLRDLLADAGARHDDVMAMLVARRAEHVLRVEQPALAPLTSEQRTEAMNAVPRLVASLDTLDHVAIAPRERAAAPVIGPRFAARLQAIGERRPPIAQIGVTMRGRMKTGAAITNDETLAASLATTAVADSSRRIPALAALSGAVALRGLAQSTPWFPGDAGPDAGPDAGDLTAEFRLADVTFSRGVPSAWRRYYLRELQQGLRDIRDVFPAMSVAGLTIAFGTEELPDSALAMHDPRTRTIRLSIGTSAGTLAHELAHDLDYQTARRMFAVAGGYSTDRALRERPGALATSVRGLGEARSMRPLLPAAGAPTPDRPAELFARGVDWFTASALALRGRTSAFLTAVQDATLPGYAAGAPSAIGAAGASSLVAAIDQMTFVPDSVRETFRSQWSDPSIVDPIVMMRRVFAAPIGRGPMVRTAAGFGPLDSMLPALRPALCVDESSAEMRARERLLRLAIDARAQGVAQRRARWRPGSPRPDWANGLLGVAPWATDAADAYVAGVRALIVTELRSAMADQGVVPAVPARFASSADGCAALAR